MITGKLNLAALIHVKMEVNGKQGKTAGIFLPIKNNSLFEGKEGAVYLDIVGFEYKEPKDFATHMIKQSFSKEALGKMSDEEKKALPILGNVKVGDGGHKDAVNDAEPGKVFDPTIDNLPF